jgi:adenosine deaminase
MTLQSLPKTELHLHLDGSMSYAAAAHLSPGLTRATFDATFIAPPKCTDLADYLTRFPAHLNLMQTAPALRIVVEDLFEQLAADHVQYAEIRYAPFLNIEGGLTLAEVVEATDRAVEDAIRATGIEARIILCTLRHYTEDMSLQTARMVGQFRGSRVAALDLAADEAGFPLDAHVSAFEYAQEHGLARTAHAGEAAGPASVRETLAKLKPSRIGHGIRSIEDADLVRQLVADGIHLEVCPSSNVQTGVCADIASHPIARLFDAGVSLSISTDNRTVGNVTLTQEYERLAQAFNWGRAEFLQCNVNALKAAFVDDTTRARLLARLHSGYSAN